jgi:hypothetical protein
MALAALVVGRVLYGTAAGAQGSGQRVAAMTLAAGVVAAVAVSNLAFGLLGLLATSVHHELGSTGGRFVAITVPLGGTVHVFVSAVDVLRVDASDEPSETGAEIVLAIIGVTLLAAGGLG